MLFFQALFALLVYDILTKFRPFKTLHSIVKGWKVAEKATGQETLDHVCTAVNYACAWYPKQALCLQRSFATTLFAQEAWHPRTVGFRGAENTLQGTCLGGSKRTASE